MPIVLTKNPNLIMKRFIPQIILACILILNSCSSDDATELDQEIIESSDLVTEVLRSTTPCDFNLNSIKANSTLKISCLMDLKGKTINLPSGVNIQFDGGDIINGTLNFSSGKIDSQLLNESLQVNGNAKLNSEIVLLDPSRWQITQGPVGKSAAFANRVNLQNAIESAKNLGATSFEIGALDAYFEVTTKTHISGHYIPSYEAINIPSNFTLKMGNDTHLRVYPNNFQKASLLALSDVTNAHIKGGHLHGDRDTHNYSGGGSHEWGFLIEVESGHDCSITGVTMSMATGDGLDIHSEKFSIDPDYEPTNNLVVSNCTFDSNRRNNVSITDGKNITVENSTFLRGGVNTTKSKGIAPRFQLVVEPYRSHENGTVVHREKVDGVVIRNNVEKETAFGGFLVHGGNNVTIEDNDTETSIGLQWASGTIIRNNNIVAPEGKYLENGIKTGWIGNERVYDNKIYGNFISGFRTGINIMSDGHEIYNNQIENFTEAGVLFRKLTDMKFYNNTIKTTAPKGRGIMIYATSAKNSEINGNKVTTKHNPLYIRYVNDNSSTENNTFTLKGNEFNSNSYAIIREAAGVTLDDNNIYAPMEIRGKAKNLFLKNNTINSSHTNRHAVTFKESVKNIRAYYNDFTAPKGKSGTYEHSSMNKNEIEERGNKYRYK